MSGAKEGQITMMGTVKKIKGGGTIVVELENGTIMDCHASGRMKKFNVKIILGDIVEVEISPYDLSKGRISKRLLDSKFSQESV